MERHAVGLLFRQSRRITAEVADLVALLLHRDVKPILLFLCGVFAQVISGGTSFFGLLSDGLVKRFTNDHSTCRTSGGGYRIGRHQFLPGVSCGNRTG